MWRVLALCSVVLLGAPRQAAAEWHITPMIGVTMLGSTSIVDPELATNRRHLNLGGAVSLIGSGMLGVEVITIWTPGFFDRGELDDDPIKLVAGSRALSLMGNVMLTTPRKWTEYSLRPFVSGGFGLMHVNVDSDLFPVSSYFGGYNIGGGAVGFLSDRTGLRFDFRYHSTVNATDEQSAFGDAHLRYVTATIGIVFRR
jgi:hypothetical protein